MNNETLDWKQFRARLNEYVSITIIDSYYDDIARMYYRGESVETVAAKLGEMFADICPDMSLL